MDASWELNELENMAQAASAADAQIADEYPSPDNIERWKKLFGYTHLEDVQLISQQRRDVTRERITDEHWALVAASKEELGYDREAYEHSLQLPNVLKNNSVLILVTGSDGKMMFLFKMGGMLDSAEKVKEVAALQELPKVVEGTGTMGLTKFCIVERDVQKRLEEWLLQRAVLQK